MRDVRLSLRARLSESIAPAERMVSLSVGPRGEAIVLLVATADEDDVLGYKEQPGWATFPNSTTSRPLSATVLIHDGRAARRVPLRDLAAAHPHVQPLPNGQVLVVAARCWRFEDGTAERNAGVYGADGALRHAATFGDGIEAVQTTTRGAIWVSYFDEGIFGNYGWNDWRARLGSSGLVRFDDRGNVAWKYAPPEGFDDIHDCYALNVSDDATWAYYYSSFPLVRIDSAGTVEAWRTEIRGARAFATDGRHVLFYGGYAEERERCLLAQVQGDAVSVTDDCRLVVTSGEPVEKPFVVGRGSELHVFSDTAWYSTDVGPVS